MRVKSHARIAYLDRLRRIAGVENDPLRLTGIFAALEDELLDRGYDHATADTVARDLCREAFPAWRHPFRAAVHG